MISEKRQRNAISPEMKLSPLNMASMTRKQNKISILERTVNSNYFKLRKWNILIFSVGTGIKNAVRVTLNDLT